MKQQQQKQLQQHNYQRQTSSALLSSLPLDIEEKRAMRKVGLFTEAQLMKYRKWFNAMDTDSSGTVNIDELSTVLLSSGVLKYKYEVENMFRQADVDKSGEISFEEFVSGIGSTIASGKLQLHKLDELVDETNVLSAETMLSQARREILMEHIIDNSLQRAAEIERASIRIDEERNRSKSRRRQHIIALTDIKKHKTLDNLVQQHHLTRMKSMHTISQLSKVLSTERVKSIDSPKRGYYGNNFDTIDLDHSLLPLESILDPSLWSLIDPSLRTPFFDVYFFILLLLFYCYFIVLFIIFIKYRMIMNFLIQENHHYLILLKQHHQNFVMQLFNHHMIHYHFLHVLKLFYIV